MKVVRWVLFSACIASSAIAQQTLQLSLSQCLSQALERNPAIAISKAKVRMADARVWESTAALLPQVKFTGRATEVSSVQEFRVPPPLNLTIFPSITEQYALRLTLQQPLFTGFRLLKSRTIAEYSRSAALAEAEKDESDVVLNVTTAYWNLYRARKIEEVLRQSLLDVRQHLSDVENFTRQGLATDVDVMKVRVQLGDINVAIIEAQNAVHVATMALNTLLGNPLETEVLLTDDPSSEEAMLREWSSKTLSEVLAAAASQRPELRTMEARSTMSREQILIAQSGWYPQIFLQANYDYARPNQRILPLKNQWDGTWDVGITVQWNVWDWFTTHQQTLQAEEAFRQTEAATQQVRDMIALDIAQQYYAVHSERARLSAVQEEAATAEESYRIASKKFKAGMLTSTELTDAETALLQAKLKVAQVSVEYCLALARFKKALALR